MRHVFLSPHMDDAVFSAGNLLLQLIKERKDVLVITLFTSFGARPISWDAQKYLFRSGFFRMSSFASARKKEDVKAMSMLGVSHTHLDFIDGGFRRDNRGNLLYPTFDQLFSGAVNPSDIKIMQIMKRTLQSLIHKSDILYAPVGVGNHADHLITNRIARTFSNKTYFWIDQPYAENKKNIFADGKYKKAFSVKHNRHKDRLIRCYTSQTRHLYPHGVPNINEVFFTKSI